MTMKGFIESFLDIQTTFEFKKSDFNFGLGTKSKKLV